MEPRSLTQLLDKQLESPSLDTVLENCRKEGIPDEELAGILDSFLNKVQAEKRETLYWERVRQESQKAMEFLDARQQKKKFLENYRSRYGVEFVLDKYSEPLIDLLCLYFTNDPKFEESGYSLKKGLLLFGGVGSGKTSIMTVFSHNQRQSFSMVDCLSVAASFSKNGYDALMPYQYGDKNRYPRDKWNQAVSTYCFDDLGVETEKKHFGNEVNIMAELVQLIYDRSNLRGNIHFTTNLGADQIREIYGQRVVSRLREMVNVIALDTESPDRRQ